MDTHARAHTTRAHTARKTAMTRIASTVALLALCVGLARAGTPSVTIAQTSGTTHYGTTDSLTGTVTFSEAVYTTGAADASTTSYKCPRLAPMHDSRNMT